MGIDKDVVIGGVELPADYAGFAPGFVGLDQIIVLIPHMVKRVTNDETNGPRITRILRMLPDKPKEIRVDPQYPRPIKL